MQEHAAFRPATRTSGGIVLQSFELVNSAKAHRQLSDTMYRYPLLAVVREAISNAADAFVKAEKPDGIIDVHLPSPASPQFVVRDYGVGLTGEELQTFARYFETTKSKDDRQTGAKGLGVKSPMAIGDHFVAVSVKDGMRSRAVAGVMESGAYGFAVVDSLPCKAENGTSIIVPVDPVRLSRLSGGRLQQPKDDEEAQQLEQVVDMYGEPAYSTIEDAYEEFRRAALACAEMVSHPLSPFQGAVRIHETDRDPYVVPTQSDWWGPMPSEPSIVWFRDPYNWEAGRQRERGMPLRWFPLDDPEAYAGQRTHRGYAYWVPDKLLYSVTSDGIRYHGETEEQTRYGEPEMKGLAFNGVWYQLKGNDVPMVRAYEADRDPRNKTLPALATAFMSAQFARDAMGIVPTDSRESVQAHEPEKKLAAYVRNDLKERVGKQTFSQLWFEASSVFDWLDDIKALPQADGTTYTIPEHVRQHFDMHANNHGSIRQYTYTRLARTWRSRTWYLDLTGTIPRNTFLLHVGERTVLARAHDEVSRQFFRALLNCPQLEGRIIDAATVELPKKQVVKGPPFRFYKSTGGDSDRAKSWITDAMLDADELVDRASQSPDDYVYAVVHNRERIAVGGGIERTAQQHYLDTNGSKLVDEVLDRELLLVGKDGEKQLVRAGVRQLRDVASEVLLESYKSLDERMRFSKHLHMAASPLAMWVLGKINLHELSEKLADHAFPKAMIARERLIGKYRESVNEANRSNGERYVTDNDFRGMLDERLKYAHNEWRKEISLAKYLDLPRPFISNYPEVTLWQRHGETLARDWLMQLDGSGQLHGIVDTAVNQSRSAYYWESVDVAAAEKLEKAVRGTGGAPYKGWEPMRVLREVVKDRALAYLKQHDDEMVDVVHVVHPEELAARAAEPAEVSGGDELSPVTDP